MQTQFFSRWISILLTTFSLMPVSGNAQPLPPDPEMVAIVDTGYDACIQNRGSHCEENRNLLIRGGEPITEDYGYEFQFNNLRTNLFSYLNIFKKNYTTQSNLPKSIDELQNYRLVVINLLYDFRENGSQSELLELEYEFLHSGQSSKLEIPEQHKMYGLDTSFHPDQYAFEWWPITFANLDETEPFFIGMHMNWPGKNGTPHHSFAPKEYQLLDFPYLITGTAWDENIESQAKDLRSLLTKIPTDGHPLLIFYHCVAGKDRTGAVSAAYFMKHGGYPFLSSHNHAFLQQRSGPVSLSKAIAYTTTDRPANAGSQKLSKAYCLTLKEFQQEC